MIMHACRMQIYLWIPKELGYGYTVSWLSYRCKFGSRLYLIEEWTLDDFVGVGAGGFGQYTNL